MENLHDRVVTQLLDRKGTWPQIATDSGVPVSTIKNIAHRKTKSPRFEALSKLARSLGLQDVA